MPEYLLKVASSAESVAMTVKQEIRMRHKIGSCSMRENMMSLKAYGVVVKA